MTGDHLRDDSRGHHRADAGDATDGDNDVIELQVGAVGERDVKVQRCRVDGAGDESDVVVGGRPVGRRVGTG